MSAEGDALVVVHKAFCELVNVLRSWALRAGHPELEEQITAVLERHLEVLGLELAYYRRED